MSRSDGSWLGTFACIERITQSSSAERATFGKSSLISSPLSPYFWKEKGDLSAAPVGRSVRNSSGIFLPSYFVSSGFGSKVSTCDGPPFMNRWTTRLARAGKCGFFGASGFRSYVPALAWSARIEPSASEPIPMPQRRSRSLRVRWVSTWCGMVFLVDEGELVRRQECVGVELPWARALLGGGEPTCVVPSLFPPFRQPEPSGSCRGSQSCRRRRLDRAWHPSGVGHSPHVVLLRSSRGRRASAAHRSRWRPRWRRHRHSSVRGA